MRVLMLYPYLPAPSIAHGSARVVSALLEGLRAAPGLHLTLLCAHRPGEREALSEVEALCDRLVSVERRFSTDMGRTRRTTERTATAVRLARTGWPVPVVKLKRSGIQRALERELASGAHDLVHVELATMAQYVLSCGDLPAVLVDHEAAGEAPEVDPRWSRYVSEVYPRFQRILCLSNEDATQIEGRVPGARPIVRAPGLSFRARRTRTAERGRLLFFGSIEHEPNRDALAWLLEEILPRIRQTRPEVQLVTAGFEGLDGPLADRARAAGVEQLGFVPDLDAELARAAAVLAPLRLGRGVRIKAIETLAQGVPLVTTTLGAQGLCEGGAVIGDSTDELVAATIRVLDDGKRAEQEARQAARETRVRHDLMTQAAFTRSIWDDLLARG